MSFNILCPNGHQLAVETAHVGRKVRCPACKVVVVVTEPGAKARPAPPPLPKAAVKQEAPKARRPAPGPSEELEELEEVEGPSTPPKGGVKKGPPPPRRPAPKKTEELEEVDQLEELEEIPDEAPPDEYAEDRRKPKGMKTGKRMRLANLGLGFHYAKVLCIAVAILLFLLSILLSFMAGMAGSLGMLQFAGIVSYVGLLLIVVTPILGGVGSLLCFWLPAKSNSRVLIIISFSLEVGGVFLIVLSVIMMFTGSAAAAEGMRGGRGMGGGLALAGMGLVMYLIAGLVIYASFILFLIVLRTLATYLRDRGTAAEAISQLIKYIVVTLGGGVLWFGTMFAIRGAAAGVVIAVGLSVTIGWLVALALSLFGILTVIGTIRQAIATRW